jgi:hypothetical protein
LYNCCVGRYKRIFSIGSVGISTYNPITFEVTNQWFYSDFISVMPILKGTSQQNNEFRITFKKDRKSDSMTFSSEHRADLLTEALHFQPLFAEKTTAMLVSFTGYVSIKSATYHEDCLCLFLQQLQCIRKILCIHSCDS